MEKKNAEKVLSVPNRVWHTLDYLTIAKLLFNLQKHKIDLL